MISSPDHKTLLTQEFTQLPVSLTFNCTCGCVFFLCVWNISPGLHVHHTEEPSRGFDLVTLESSSLTIGTTRYIHGCPQCGRRFTTKGNMTRHLKKCGSAERADCDPCQLCGKSFISPDSLKTHMAIVHPTGMPVQQGLGVWETGESSQ